MKLVTTRFSGTEFSRTQFQLELDFSKAAASALGLEGSVARCLCSSIFISLKLLLSDLTVITPSVWYSSRIEIPQTLVLSFEVLYDFLKMTFSYPPSYSHLLGSPWYHDLLAFFSTLLAVTFWVSWIIAPFPQPFNCNIGMLLKHQA